MHLLQPRMDNGPFLTRLSCDMLKSSPEAPSALDKQSEATLSFQHVDVTT